MLNRIDAKTKRQIQRFIVAGCGAVGTDTAIYFLLINNAMERLGYDWCKFISFLTGSCVAFLINKYWTFESKRKSLFEVAAFLVIYLTTLGLNVSVNHMVLRITNNISVLAFLIATGCSTVANFLGQKFWVFRVRET